MVAAFEERKIATESPTDALIDEAWVVAAATEMGRVFLHLEMKLVRQVYKALPS